MDDIQKQMCIDQGYIPETCTLPGVLVWGLVNKQGNPCIGCNEKRSVCKGNIDEWSHKDNIH